MANAVACDKYTHSVNRNLNPQSKARSLSHCLVPVDICVMANAVACDKYTHSVNETCNYMPEWRECMTTAIDPQECSGFCQVANRYYDAHRLQHEV